MSIFSFVIVGCRQKISNFCNFRKIHLPVKIEPVPSLKEYFTLFLLEFKEKIGAIFEKILKMSQRLQIKYP